MHPDVSVCMPAHRDTDGFRRALRSVLDQGHRDLEVIVSDDSGGALEPAVREAADSRIRYFANPNPLGFACNHTTTLDRTRGRYLAFLHDDDYWLPEYLAQARERFDADPSLGMVCSAYWVERGDGRLERLPSAPAGGRHARWLPLIMRYSTFIPSSTLLRREVWEQVRRPWPDIVVGDLVLWIDTALRDWPLYWLDEPLAVYCYHPAQISHNEEDFRNADVTLFGSYTFPDPQDERLRRERLAHAYIARAGLRLRQGRPGEARSDLGEASRLAPLHERSRRLAYTVLANGTWLLPIATRAWALRRGRGPRASGEPRGSTRPGDTTRDPGPGQV